MRKPKYKRKCLLCENEVGWFSATLGQRFCGAKCKSEYHKLMTNLALARLNAAPPAETPVQGDRGREIHALVRMMQADLDEQTRFHQVGA